MDSTLYKALTEDGRSPYQHHPWPLPSRVDGEWTPGEWVDAGEGELAEEMALMVLPEHHLVMEQDPDGVFRWKGEGSVTWRVGG